MEEGPRPVVHRSRPARALLAALALTASRCAGASQQDPAATSSGARAQIGAPVALTFDRPDASTLALASFSGRAVLLVCILMDDLSSQATARNAEQLARAHPDDLAVVVVVGDRQPYSRLRQMVQVYRGVLELTRSEVVLADDDLREGRSALGEIPRVPTVYLVNRAGRLARRVEGYQGPAQLAALVAPALPPRATPSPAADPAAAATGTGP